MAMTHERLHRVGLAVSTGASNGSHLDGAHPATPADRLATMAIVILCATFPLSQLVVIPVVGPVTDLSAVLAAVLAVVALARGRLTRPPAGLLSLALGYSTWAVLSYFWSATPDRSAARAVTYVSLLVTIGVLGVLLREAQDLRAAMQAYVVGCAVLVVEVLANFAAGQQANASITVARYSAGAANPNRLGAMVALGMVMAWALLRSREGARFWKTVNAGVVVVGPLVVLLTASRATFLATMPLAAVLVTSSVRSSARGRFGAGALVVVALVVASSLVPESSVDRLQALYEGGETAPGASSVAKREDALYGGIDRFWARPVHGWGTGSYAEVIQPLTERSIVAHNTWISILVELGLIGFGLFVAIPVWCLARLQHCRGSWRATGLLLVATWTMVTLFASFEDEKTTWLVFAVVAAMGVATTDGQGETTTADELPTTAVTRVGRLRS